MITSATGITGHIMYVGEGQYAFRLYDYTKNPATFIDYDLMHSDLMVTIVDADAALYTGRWRSKLDHSPKTLGHTNE